MEKKKLVRFSLEEWQANPKRTVVTDNGRVRLSARVPAVFEGYRTEGRSKQNQVINKWHCVV